MGIFSKLFGGKGTGMQANQPTFYVFGLQGPAFGQPQGDLMPEKAKALKDGYAPAANMQLKLVRPSEWDGKINVSNSGGVITTSVNLKDHQPAMRGYLLKQAMKVSTTATGTVAMNLPYACRCAFCGTGHPGRGEDHRRGARLHGRLRHRRAGRNDEAGRAALERRRPAPLRRGFPRPGEGAI